MILMIIQFMVATVGWRFTNRIDYNGPPIKKEKGKKMIR